MQAIKYFVTMLLGLAVFIWRSTYSRTALMNWITAMMKLPKAMEPRWYLQIRVTAPETQESCQGGDSFLILRPEA